VFVKSEVEGKHYFEKRKGTLMGAFVLCCTANLDATLKKSIKSRDFGYWMWFYVHPK